MPIQLDNAQYNAFVSFALGANDENAIAHAAGAAPADPLAGRTISARTGDSVHALTRTTDSRKANDAARELFRKAIVQIFGGEKRIPPSVRKAMILSDFGKGRPLATQLDIGPLREIALRKPFSVADVAPVLRATAKALADIGETH